jgi:hypothetical protein
MVRRIGTLPLPTGIGARLQAKVENGLLKERCLINRFSIREPLVFLRSQGAELAFPGPPEPLGLRRCAKGGASGGHLVYIVRKPGNKMEIPA